MTHPSATDLISALPEFDPSEVAAVVAAQIEAAAAGGSARAIHAAHQRSVRRAVGEARLAEILPPRLEAGASMHVISHGDVDSLSYFAHWLGGTTHFDYAAISTWCVARADLDRLAAWLDAGLIDELELYVGEIFPSQYGDEYDVACQLVQRYGVRLVVARNHSKVMLAANEGDGYYLVIESSANVNTNPRIEQTATHHDRDLFSFYRDFYRGLRSIDRRP